MKQLTKFIVLFLIIIPILSGCWNSRELDDLSISNAIGVDKINGEYMFTTQIINPSELSKNVAGKRTVITTIDETGETIFQAWRKLTTESKSKLYFSHVRVLVIGEETAREGISEILDVLLRDHDFRSDFLLVVAKDHTANDVLSVLTTLNVIPGDKMFEALTSSSEHYGTTSEIPLDKFITDLMSKGKNPITTGVLITGKVEEGRYTSKYEDIKPEVTLKYGTLGAFKEDKLIGWMNEEQSRGYNFAVGNIKSTLLNTPCVNNEGVMGIEVIRTKAKMSAQKKMVKSKGKFM
ncbi:Ger(x)C family spore germination protein [Filobacillus milosensis]|uniref:Ger(X)C family spore germination protein n=1 Tax=Filobacillus milosensis TaxID=94137 RepID=A0A4Y8IP40_9BACI|nr:Ger(x)C family spore germination protein [Filobacillus milosensis]TFB22154.1 Ger(x)C family spore germination protein [Filobacillus milosensis]